MFDSGSSVQMFVAKLDQITNGVKLFPQFITAYVACGFNSFLLPVSPLALLSAISLPGRSEKQANSLTTDCRLMHYGDAKNLAGLRF